MKPIDRLNEQDLQIILARQEVGHHDIEDKPDPGPESALQAKIRENCRQRGWPCLSFPQTPDVKKFLPPGWPDETIIMPYSNVLFIEDKKKKGRLSDDQRLMKSMFRYLGHNIHEVRSFKRYAEITEGILRR